MADYERIAGDLDDFEEVEISIKRVIHTSDGEYKTTKHLYVCFIEDSIDELAEVIENTLADNQHPFIEIDLSKNNKVLVDYRNKEETSSEEPPDEEPPDGFDELFAKVFEGYDYEVLGISTETLRQMYMQIMKRQGDDVDFSNPAFVDKFERRIRLVTMGLAKMGIIVSDNTDEVSD